MGCSNTKRTSYLQAENDEEVEIRKFEEEIGIFKKSLSKVLPRICIDREVIPISTLDDFVVKDFSETFLNLIRRDYFYKDIDGVRYYDARKINLLFFLLTKDSIIDNGIMKYYEKASFIFTFIKTGASQNISDAINKNEEDFINFMNELVTIACEVIVDCYYNIKNVRPDGYLKKFRDIKEKISEKLIQNLFATNDPSSADSLSFSDLNKKLEGNIDSYVFSSGWIRDDAWDILIKGAANELEQKMKEESDKNK